MPKLNTNIQQLGENIKKAAQKKVEIESAQPEAPRPTVLGRKKRLTTKRDNAVTVYLTDEMAKQLEEVKYNNRVERQRVIQTALYEFLRSYYQDKEQALDRDGFDKVREFEKKISVD